MLTTATKIEVTLVDGSVETVELKRLTIRQLYHFVEVLSAKSSADAVALCAGKPVEWVDTLSDASFKKLAKAVHDENFPRAMELSDGDNSMAIAIAPYISKMLKADGMVGSVRSPSSPSPASAEVTPNESSTSPTTGLSS